MAAYSFCSHRPNLFIPFFILLIILPQSHPVLGARRLTALVQTQPLVLTYHKGQLLRGSVAVNTLWYGAFTPAQRTVVTDFLASLSSNKTTKGATHPTTQPQPSVATWWATVEKYYARAKTPIPSITLGSQTLDQSYSLGKRLTSAQLAQLAAKVITGKQSAAAISVILTAPDVAIDGFCMSRCGTHASIPAATAGKATKNAYIWVGNPATQCPGQCAWPFHQPLYGPQTPPLVAPNGDVGVDGMVINLASLLAGTVTNPFGNGYFQGPKEAPLEAASACPGVYGKGAYPGYAGDLLVDGTTGASYNANGINGRKYLLPALVDPTTAACLTLV